MRTVASAFTKLARALGVAVRVRIRVIRKSDGWTVDLSDHCGADWITGLDYAENLDASTVDFSFRLVRAIGENTLVPIRASKANRKDGVSDPVLVSKRWVIVEVQPVPSESAPDADAWIEVLRGQIERVSWNRDEITVSCRDESAVYLDRWQEYERNWPETIPQQMEDVLQDLLDAGAYDPGPWIANHGFTLYSFVRPTRHNGYLYQCTSGVGNSWTTEPSWPTSIGGTVTEAGGAPLEWTCVSTLPASAWSGTTAYPAGAIVRPTTRNGYLYRCTAAGTSGVGEPTWPETYAETVSDGTVTWKMIGDLPALESAATGWAVTRAEANDYGSPPQAYYDIMRAFVDQAGFDLRWSWIDGKSQRRPRLRKITDGSSGYAQIGDAGTFESDEYEVVGDVEVNSSDIRNAVEVVYFDGPEAGPRTKTVYRLQDQASVDAYGSFFCQLSLDSTSIINEGAEAVALAQRALAALSQPTVRLKVRLAYNPWIEVGDGLKLKVPPEDALFGATDTAETSFVGVVQGLTHRVGVDESYTEVFIRGLYVAGADTSVVAPSPPVGGDFVLAREVRARRTSSPTFSRPPDVVVHRFEGAGYSLALGAGKAGAGSVTLDDVYRDLADSGGTGATAFTAPVAGLYSISAQVTISAAPAAGTEMWLYLVNGGIEKITTYAVVGTTQAGASMVLALSGAVYLGKNDAVGLKLAATGSPTLTISSGVEKTYLNAKLIH